MVCISTKKKQKQTKKKKKKTKIIKRHFDISLLLKKVYKNLVKTKSVIKDIK